MQHKRRFLHLNFRDVGKSKKNLLYLQVFLLGLELNFVGKSGIVDLDILRFRDYYISFVAPINKYTKNNTEGQYEEMTLKKANQGKDTTKKNRESMDTTQEVKNYQF